MSTRKPGGTPNEKKFRLQLGDERHAITLACAAEERSARIGVLQDIVERMRPVAPADKIFASVRRAAEAVSPDQLRAILLGVDYICRGKVRPESHLHPAAPELHGMMPFGSLFEMWNSGALARLFPGYVRPIKTAKDQGYIYVKYAKPIVHEIPVALVTLDHGLQVVNSVPEGLSQSHRRNVAMLLLSPMRYAKFPCRIIDSSPFPTGFLPKVGKRRAMACLYPDEDAQYLACVKIYLVERMLEGLLIREGMRVEELAGAQVRDFDRNHGVFHLDENKTDDPRSWDLSPGSAQALSLYLDHFHPNPAPEQPLLVQGDDIRTSGQRLVSRARAGRLRENARLAKLTRPQLWMHDGSRRHLVLHDLRAAFITIHLALGMTEAWIARRTGHQSSDQINRYRRDADTLRALQIGPLAPLHLAIPELAELVRALAPAAPTPAPPTDVAETARPLFALPPDAYDAPLAEGLMAPQPIL